MSFKKNLRQIFLSFLIDFLFKSDIFKFLNRLTFSKIKTNLDGKILEIKEQEQKL